MGGNECKYDKVTYEFIWKKVDILGIYEISDDENALVIETFLGNLSEVIFEKIKFQGSCNCRGF